MVFPTLLAKYRMGSRMDSPASMKAAKCMAARHGHRRSVSTTRSPSPMSPSTNIAPSGTAARNPWLKLS